MNAPHESGFSRITSRFETFIIRTMQVLLAVVILIAAIELWMLLVSRVWDGIFSEIGTVGELQEAVKRSFAGVLLVVLGLEILESLRTYSAEHRVRLETILIVAIVAMGRHVIQLDIEHHDGVQLIGIGALFLALSGGYFLVKRVG
jgi:uncharacterized membrane protein (DUF373 family)